LFAPKKHGMLRSHSQTGLAVGKADACRHTA